LILSLQNVKLKLEKEANKEAKKEELEMKKEELEVEIWLIKVSGLIEIQNHELEYKEKSMEWQ
jgi:hypothetical protein